MEEGREETPNTEVGQQPPTCEPGSVLEPTTGWSSGTSGESSQDPTAPSWSGSGGFVATGEPERSNLPAQGDQGGPVAVKEPRRPPQWFVVAALAAVIGAAVGAGVAEAIGTGSPNPARDQGRASDARARLAAGESIPTIVKSVLPEVVSIDAKGLRTRGSSWAARQRTRGPG